MHTQVHSCQELPLKFPPCLDNCVLFKVHSKARRAGQGKSSSSDFRASSPIYEQFRGFRSSLRCEAPCSFHSQTAFSKARLSTRSSYLPSVAELAQQFVNDWVHGLSTINCSEGSIPQAIKFYWHQWVKRQPTVPDKSVPWFQGTLVINERNTPKLCWRPRRLVTIGNLVIRRT